MDVEFHYYMTYLVAAAAGYPPADALKIAYASQYVDDNKFQFDIDKGQPSAYQNYISQTMDILKPKDRLMRIYPIFHFVPGEPMSETCMRLDGCLHMLNTTPGNQNATELLRAALQTDDLQRIGVATHAFADTWAHQNFVGYFDAFNAMNGPLEKLSPNIGHADAGHLPDLPTAVWQDPRMVSGQVDNRQRFLDAAEAVMAMFMSRVDPAMGPQEASRRLTTMRLELNQAMGKRDDRNVMSRERIARYIALGEKPFFGGRAIPRYDSELWLDMAVNEEVRGLKDRWMGQNLEFLGREIPMIADKYSWRDPVSRQTTDWWRFQEAVKAHQDMAWAMLRAGSMKFMSMQRL